MSIDRFADDPSLVKKATDPEGDNSGRNDGPQLIGVGNPAPYYEISVSDKPGQASDQTITHTGPGAGAWRQPHEYVDPSGIYAGEIGTYEGVAFIESPRLPNSQAGSGAGASQVRVYDTFIMGQQALAEAVAEEPHTVIGPVTDKLMRLRPIGWYGVLGWNLYRPEAMWRVQTASSVRPAA